MVRKNEELNAKEFYSKLNSIIVASLSTSRLEFPHDFFEVVNSVCVGMRSHSPTSFVDDASGSNREINAIGL